VLEVIITNDFDIDSWGLIEERKLYREWCVPAEPLEPLPPAAAVLTDEEISLGANGPSIGVL
jgi:hypothetical protein